MSEDWTHEEVEIIVTEYFGMLTKELSGIPYNKSEVRKRIIPLLKSRSESSVEFKNRNISAVLVKMGQPYIRGYLPAFNYQKLLLEGVVLSHVRQKPEVEDAFKLFAEALPAPKELIFENMLEELPKMETVMHEQELIYRSPIKINYIEREQANQVT